MLIFAAAITGAAPFLAIAVYRYSAVHWAICGAIIALVVLLHLVLIARRIQLESRLREQAAAGHDWQQTFNSISDLVCLIDTSHVIRQVNRAMAERLGRTPEEIIGQSCYACIHQASAPPAACPHQELLRDGRAHSAELKLECFGGWFDVSVSPRKDMSGKLIGSVHICRDITSRKRALERLEKINTSLLDLGADYNLNIGRLTALAGEMLDGTCAFYNRLEDGRFSAVAPWQSPPDFNPEFDGAGCLCHDLVAGAAGENFVYVPDLRQTPYAETDANIRKYNLHSCLGHVVRCDGRAIGALCVAFERFYTPSQDDKYLFGILAAAIAVEENRQKAHSLILAGNQKFQDLVETITDCIWEVDAEGRYTYVSPRVKDILGYAPEEVLGKALFDFMLPGDAQYLEGIFKAMAAEQKPIVDLQNVKIHKDKRLVALETNGVPFFDARGEFKGYRGADRDITKRIKAEKKAAMLAHAIDTAHHGCLVLSSDYDVVFANDYALAKLGFDFDEIKGVSLFSFCADKEHANAIIEALAAAGRWMGESFVRKKDGGRFPALISVSAARLIEMLENEQYVLLFQDISAQKQIQEQLFASEKLAVMGRLVADVTHELNNPLAIIIGGTQMMLGRLDKKEAEMHGQLERILRNARRCKTILSNLLSYGRTVGKKTETLDLVELIHEAVTNVGYQHDMSGIEVAFPSVKLAGLGVAGNRAALLSVFVNLIRNARQAMGANGRLTIMLEKQEDNVIRIDIHDTGLGIAREQMAQLFKPFASGWKEEEGSGLGLATSLGIVEAHGGHMSASSQGPGHGAVFTILLPAGLKKMNSNES